MHVATVPQSLNFLRAQIGHVRQRDFEVHVIASPGGSLVRFAAEQQVAAHAVPMPRRITPLRDLWTVGRLWRLFRRLRPDIVHGHTPKGGLLAMIAARLSGVPVRLYHIHGLPLMTAMGPRRRLLRWTEKIACTFAGQVLCVSPSVRAAAIAEGLCPADKVRVLLNGSIDGVDADKFDPERLPPQTRPQVRQQYGIPEQAIVIGFVGRIVRDKGLIELMQAWQTIRADFADAHLLVVGEAEPQDPLPPETEARLRQDPRVHLAGVVRDMPPMYAAMDFIVLPTYREGFPVVPLEAAAMGLPVIATRIPGCIDAIEDGVTGTLVPPRDAEALAEAMRGYLLDAERRRQQGRNGRRRVLRDFRPEEMAESVYGEYQRLLRQRGASGATFYRRRGKRLLDLALTVPALIVLSPLLLVLTVLVRLTLGAPVFFRQRRSGRNGETFTILKFRTMREQRDAAGARLPDSRRLTRLGRFLRRQLGRTARTIQHPQGRHEPRRSPAADSALFALLLGGGAEALPVFARTHRLGAGQRAQFARLGPASGPRCLVRGRLLVAIGPQDPVQDRVEGSVLFRQPRRYQPRYPLSRRRARLHPGEPAALAAGYAAHHPAANAAGSPGVRQQ